MTTDMQREAFERWISNPLEGGAFFGKPNFSVDGENEFTDPDVYGAWLTWQAAQAELTELRAIVARLRESVSFADDYAELAIHARNKFLQEQPGEAVFAMRAALNAYRKRILEG